MTESLTGTFREHGPTMRFGGDEARRASRTASWVAGLGRTVGLMAALLALSLAAAQGYGGSYVLPTDSGDITLLLQQQGNAVQGEMRLDGFTYQVEGEVDDVGIYGYIWSGQEELYFEAELQGDGLYMIMAMVDPATGEPDPATAGEYLFQRAAGGGAPTGGAPGGGIGGTPGGTGAGGAGAPANRGAKVPPGNAPPSTAGAAPAQPAAATSQPPEMQLAQVGQVYQAGTRVGSAGAGASFVVPASYYAGYHPGENAFLIMSDSQPGLVIVSALSRMSVDDAVAQLGGAFESDGTTLYPQGQPQRQGNVVRARYSVVTGQGQGAAYLVGVAGDGGNVLVLAALGAGHEAGVLETLVEGIVASALLTTPTRTSADTAAANLAGAQFRVADSTTSNGFDDSAFSSSSTELDLCRDGSYRYRYHYAFNATVQGAGGAGGVTASDRDLREDFGSWQMESGLLGPVVVLASGQGGDRTYLPLLESGGTLYVDGMPVTVGASPNCG